MDHGATGTGAIYSPEGAVDTLIATIPVGSDPGTPTYDPANGNLYASNFGSGNVSVISGSTDTVIATVSVGTYPSAPAYDPANGTLYVSNSGLNNVSVISDSTDTVIDTVPVGQGPSTPAYDSANGDLYVANRYSNTVSVIFTTTPPSHLFLVAFTETGLPTNTSWSVTLNGTTRTSTSGTTTFYEPIGTYAYAVGSVTGYKASPSSGTVTVNGAAVGVSIAFTQVTYPVTFTETGLPSGTSWSVTLAGTTKSSTGSSITFAEPNGTYGFMVGPVSGYTVSPQSGTVTADGAAVSQSSATSTNTFSEPNGTYAYTWAR